MSKIKRGDATLLKNLNAWASERGLDASKLSQRNARQATKALGISAQDLERLALRSSSFTAGKAEPKRAPVAAPQPSTTAPPARSFELLGWEGAESLAAFQRDFLHPGLALEVIIDEGSMRRPLLLKVSTADAFAHYPIDAQPHTDLAFGSRGWGFSLARELVNLSAAITGGTTGTFLRASTLKTGLSGGPAVMNAPLPVAEKRNAGDWW